MEKCVGNAEYLFTITKLPVTKNVDEFISELFVRIWKMVYQFLSNSSRGKEMGRIVSSGDKVVVVFDFL